MKELLDSHCGYIISPEMKSWSLRAQWYTNMWPSTEKQGIRNIWYLQRHLLFGCFPSSMTYRAHTWLGVCHGCYKFEAWCEKARVRYGTSRQDTDTKTVPLRVRLWLNQKFYLFFSNKKLSMLFKCNLLMAETVLTKYGERSSSLCMHAKKEKTQTTKYKVSDSFKTHSLTS